MNQTDIERVLLEKLYEPYFRERNGLNLHDIREELGVDETKFWNIVDEMSHKGLIRARAMGGYYEIDAVGAITAENEGFSPEEMTKENQHIRTVVLDQLASIYEKGGSIAEAYIETMSQDLSIDINLLANNLQILEDLGYIESVSMGSFKITYKGLDSVRKWRQSNLSDAVQQSKDFVEKNISRNNTDTDELLKKARQLFYAGEYSKAIEIFEEILKIDPHNFEAQERLNTAQDNLKNGIIPETAVPFEARAAFGRAQSLERARRLYEAKESYKQAIEITKKSFPDMPLWRPAVEAINRIEQEIEIIKAQNGIIAYFEISSTLNKFEKLSFLKAGEPLRVFICHGKGDKAIARKLHESLDSLGINPWFDEENLLPGQDWELEIIKAVQESDIVLVCLSTKSVQKTGFIQKEIKLALDAADKRPEGKIFLIPVRIDDCDIPSRLKSRQWVDLFDERGFERLVLALKSYCASD